VYGTLDTFFYLKIKMDSSSDFGPVGKGFMAFHFCRKRGRKKKIALIREKYFFGLGRRRMDRGRF